MDFLNEAQFKVAKESCINRIKYAHHHACEKWPEHLHELKMPLIEFSNTMRTCAGKAYIKRNLIKLSAKILRLNGLAFVNRTPVHELAHIVADIRYQMECHHDKRWRHVMGVLGVPKEEIKRCHSFGTGKNTYFKYHCECTEEKIMTMQVDCEEGETSNMFVNGRFVKMEPVGKPYTVNKRSWFTIMTHMKLQEKPRTCRKCKHEYVFQK